MTDKELMQQAADKLSIMVGYPGLRLYHEDIRAVLTTLRERLAQPLRTHWDGCDEVHPECRQPEQEPVAWLVQYSNKHEFVWGQKPQWIADAIGIEPLYTTPQRREWVGLTEEEIKSLPQWFPSHETAAVLPLIRAIEAKLREKNA